MADGTEVLPPRVRKPSLKRRLAENDDEDDTPAPKRAAKAARARRPRAVSDDISSPDDGLSELAKSRPLSPVEDMDVDIEGGGSPATAASSQPRSQSTSALKKSVDAISSRPKRRTLKRAVVSSDSDSVNEYNDPQGAAMEREEDSDDEPPPPTKDRGKERDRPTPASSVIRNGKGILSTKIPKKKPTMDDKPITIKDESKKVTSSSATPMLATTGLNETSKGNDTPKDLAKRKLGAIPKKKTALGSTPPIASSASTNKTAPADPLDLLQNPTKLAAKRRDMDKPAEINLFNTSTLQDLFKSSNMARTSSNVRTEERRKVLDKMREEARVKREASLQNCFDLQAPLELIARFEDKWREANRPIYYPSCLSAALYERHRASQSANAPAASTE